jgi:hypothetical protein
MTVPKPLELKAAKPPFQETPSKIDYEKFASSLLIRLGSIINMESFQLDLI